MRGQVLVVAHCGVLAEAFLSTPPTTRGKWRLGTARKTVEDRSVVRRDGGSGSGEPPVPPDGPGSGDSEDSGGGGGEELKRVKAIVAATVEETQRATRLMRLPSGDVLGILGLFIANVGLILTTFIILLIRIDDVGKDLDSKIDKKIGNLDFKVQLSTVVTWVALAYLVSASNKT